MKQVYLVRSIEDEKFYAIKVFMQEESICFEMEVKNNKLLNQECKRIVLMLKAVDFKET